MCVCSVHLCVCALFCAFVHLCVSVCMETEVKFSCHSLGIIYLVFETCSFTGLELALWDGIAGV